MPVTVTLTDACTGTHAKITAVINSRTVEVLTSRAELIGPISDDDVETAIVILCRYIAKQQNFANWNQAKTYFTNRQILA